MLPGTLPFGAFHEQVDKGHEDVRVLRVDLVSLYQGRLSAIEPTELFQSQTVVVSRACAVRDEICRATQTHRRLLHPLHLDQEESQGIVQLAFSWHLFDSCT